jgi:hypothetical protein
MSYLLDANGNPVLGPDGHPIPAVQGVVTAAMEPIQHKRTSAGGGASAEGVTIGTLLDCPACSSTPCACKKGG